MICFFWVRGTTVASQKAFFCLVLFWPSRKVRKVAVLITKYHTPLKKLELNITYGEDVKWMNSLLDAFISSIPSTHWEEPCQPRQSCRCPHLHSALIRCLIIDCGQLVKPSSCFGRPPRPPVARLPYCTSLYTAHGQGKPTLLPTATRSAFLPVIVSAAARQMGRRSRAVTQGDSRWRNSAVHFHVRKMNREKSPQGIALCNLLCLSLHPQFMRL